jgi:rare lipoprotein A
MKRIVSLAVLPLLLVACGDNTNKVGGGYGGAGDGFTEESLDGAAYTADAALLAPAPKYYLGSPYKVENTQYVPAEDLTYNQTGIAGIIPTELNGAQTTNGESFDASAMVATSKVLPLPSIIRVTNLENNAVATLRVNNRGPFVNSRIIDVSPAAARKLGMSGNTKVQVQILAEQSMQVKNATLGTTSMAAPVAVVPAGDSSPSYAAPVASAGGAYSVQAGAFYSEDSAQSLANRLRNYGNVQVANEASMYKVRVVGLDAAGARRVIDGMRSSEGLVPGLLKDGRWVNADSI